MNLLRKLRLCYRILTHQYRDGEPYFEITLSEADPKLQKKYAMEILYYIGTTAFAAHQNLSCDSESKPEDHINDVTSIVSIGGLYND